MGVVPLLQSTHPSGLESEEHYANVLEALVPRY